MAVGLQLKGVFVTWSLRFNHLDLEHFKVEVVQAQGISQGTNDGGILQPILAGFDIWFTIARQNWSGLLTPVQSL